MRNRWSGLVCLTAVCLASDASAVLAQGRESIDGVADPSPGEPSGDTIRLTFDQAVEMVRDKARRLEASALAVEAASARVKQARSARWPELNAAVTAKRMDEPLNFLFPSTTIAIPEMTIPIPSQTVVIPANVFGPGFPPVDVPLSTPPSSFTMPSQNLPVPEQDIKLADRDIGVATLSLVYPIYTGGLRSAKTAQAEAGLEVARQEKRKTEQEIVFDVTRAYYGVVLARRLVEIASDSLARMEATLDLTERMYQTGSGSVKKTDYLRNKSAVETLRSAVALLQEKKQTARAGLAAVLDLKWDANLAPTATEIPFDVRDRDLAVLVDTALRSSPDLARVRAAVDAAEAQVREAKSGRLPKLALMGSAARIWNDYDAGAMTDQNKTSWSVGFGVEVPIFQGFRTSARIAESRASAARTKTQHDLLRQGKALEVQQAYYRIERGTAQEASAREAMQAAIENRDLNARAYQDDLVETKDVIESQLLAAWLRAQYELVRFDHLESRAHLDLVVGAVDPGSRGYE